MINIQDYKSYILQNYNFIELLRENNSLIYDRLSDVFKVLEFVEMMIDDNKEVEEDLEIIFDVGFSYIFEQLEDIKVYYNNYFNRDYPSFSKYEKFINYILYLYDLEDVLKEKLMYTSNIKTSIDQVADEIENILNDKIEVDEKIFEKFNSLLEQNIPVGILTTLEIYAMIVEELAI